MSQPSPTQRPTPRSRTFVAVAVVAVFMVLGGSLAPWAYSAFVDTTAKDRIGAAPPPPPLFPDVDITAIGRRIEAQGPTARELMDGWWSQHDATADDAAFVTWLEQTLPPPPTAPRRNREIEHVQRIAATRTTAGVSAATWLGAYGKKDVWKLAAHDQAEMLPTAEGESVKNDIDAMLSMSKDVADALGATYQQSAPYVVDPSLRPDHTVAPGDVCPCSYPSRHATSAAAATTYLAHLSPHRADDYRWMQEQIAWSRIYMAGHVPSDITGGALLGDMIGDYFLVTRGHEAVPTPAPVDAVTATTLTGATTRGTRRGEGTGRGSQQDWLSGPGTRTSWPSCRASSPRAPSTPPGARPGRRPLREPRLTAARR